MAFLPTIVISGISSLGIPAVSFTADCSCAKPGLTIITNIMTMQNRFIIVISLTVVALHFSGPDRLPRIQVFHTRSVPACDHVIFHTIHPTPCAHDRSLTDSLYTAESHRYTPVMHRDIFSSEENYRRSCSMLRRQYRHYGDSARSSANQWQ